MPLAPTDRLLRCPSGLFFECRGIARAVPVKIDKIEFCLDFHIYPIVDFDLLLGSPLENLLQEKSSQGSLSYEFGETAFTPPITYLEIPMVEHHYDHNLFEEMMLASQLISPNIASPPDPLNEELLEENTREGWSDRIIDFSEAVWVESPSTIIPCSIRWITVEAQLVSNMEGNIMPWHLAHPFLGNVSLKPSGKLLESCPFGHILECRWVASAVPITIDKIEVNLDFHIFNVLDFDLLIGYPPDNLHHTPLGSLHE